MTRDIINARQFLRNMETDDVAASCSLDVSLESLDSSSPVLFLSKKAISCDERSDEKTELAISNLLQFASLIAH